VFERLRGGPCSVGQIVQGMDVSRPAVSQHLKILKATRLVVDPAKGGYTRCKRRASKRFAVGSTDSGMERLPRSRKQLKEKPKNTKGNHEER
jgi:DNA-binding transcriptional ArsR family regulator